MKFNFGTFFIQFIIAVGLFYVFDYFNLSAVFIIVVVVVIGIIVILNILKVKNREMYLELTCDSNLYLKKLEQIKHSSSLQNEYNLGLAYAYINKGKYELAQTHLDLVDQEEIKKVAKYNVIYVRVLAKLAYESQNLEVLQRIINDTNTIDALTGLTDYVQSLILLNNEQYEDAIQLLMEYIPKQLVRLYVIELEYYLGFAYKMNNQIEDAKAVLAFVVKKGFSLIYTDLAYELYMEIKD